jgi:hypothetical protein
MRSLILGLVGVGVCLFVSACSGSDESSGKCSNSSGCGGNVVGNWKVTSSCTSVDLGSMMNSTCPNETVSTSGLKVSGSVTFGADLTYTSNFTLNGSISLTIPSSCLTQNGITLTCDQLSQAFAAQPMMMGTSAGSCSKASGGCSCKATVSDQTTTETGTYTTTASGALTLMPSTGTTETDTYCVKGSTLTLSPSSDTTSSGTVTLAKQ